jgi:Sec-independent protein secretion pathway component TatC
MNTSSEKTNTLAIVSLILAFFVPLVGAILGHVAMGQIKKTGEQGRGIALAAVIIGWVLTALSVLGAILFFIPFLVLGVDVLGGM